MRRYGVSGIIVAEDKYWRSNVAEVGTTKLYENDRVIVWDMLLAPGEQTGVHTHRHSYFFQVLEGSTLETLDAEGNSLGSFDFETGSTVWIDLDGDDIVLDDLRVSATHDAKNVGNAPYREILVELK